MKAKRKLEKLEVAMNDATDYTQWSEAAQEHDRVSGAEVWRQEADTSLYDWKLIKSRTQLLRRLRRANDIPRLVFYLHEELHGNLGNMANPALYKVAKFGTKHLVTDYLSEVSAALNDLCRTQSEDLSHAEKMRFFTQAAHSFGRSALLLSGGASLGLFHIGVIKTLWLEGLLTKVLSGSSAGAIMAAVAATHNDTELSRIFDPGYIRIEAWRDFGLDSLFEGRGLGDSKKLRNAVNRNVPKWTFEETVQRTGRIVNISISPTNPNQFPRLLNHLNAPNVFVRSAVEASCAIPGLFKPVVLKAKNFSGRTVPYMRNSSWEDGSLKMDVPKTHIARMHNVNHFIVSQTNPHVIPFLAKRDPDNAALFTLELIKSTTLVNVEHILDRLRQHAESPALSVILDKAHAIASQSYSGDINIVPTQQTGNILKTFVDPSAAHIADFVADGERSVWPMIERIRNTTCISRTFEQCLEHLHSNRTTP